MERRPSLLLVLLLTAVASACAHAINYLDPAGPRYAHDLAPPVDPAACADPGRGLTVVTFNIQYGRRIDLAIDLLRSTPELKGADVLLLQEMNAPGVERMAAGLALNALFMPSGVHPRTGQDFGTAVLSRWPIEDGRRIVLPHEAFWTKLATAATAATVRCGTRRVRVMSVHLPSPGGASYDQRRDQVEALIAGLASVDDPVIVGGDFNARWIGSLFEKAGFAWLNKDLPGTRSFLGIGQRYDHLFARVLRPAAGGPSAGVADAGGASDHKPVWARLAIPPVRGAASR